MAKKVVSLLIFMIVSVGAFITAQDFYRTDRIVAVVGNSVVLYSEVDEVSKLLQNEYRQQGYTPDRNLKIEALEHLMLQKLLYNQALIDSVPQRSYAQIVERVDEQVGDMVAQVGSVQELEELFHSPIYEIKRIFQERFEEQSLASEMRETVTEKVTITPGEVERYFKRMHKDSIPIVPPQYVYGQITLYPESTKEAKLRTREMLLGLRERIIEGTRFDVLARMYGQDETAVKGGELGPMTLEQMVAPFAKAVEKLKPGQISEVVETMYGFHLVQLIEKKGPQYFARHILVRPEFTADELQATVNKLDSIASAIRADSITFEKAALQYSDDKYSKYNGGLASNLELLEFYNMGAAQADTKHFKEDLVIEAPYLDKLQPGEISPAFLTQDMKGSQLAKIVKLIEVIPSHPANLEEDYVLLEQRALYDKSEKVFKEWLDKKIGGMYIRIDPEFRIPEEFENKSWVK